MTFEIVNADDMPSWVLQPLAGHIQDAIGILEEGYSGRGGTCLRRPQFSNLLSLGPACSLG